MNRKVPFPRTAKYDPAWIRENSLGANVLYQTESLAEILLLTEGHRVLDLGCGKAISSIFLAREFGASVWAIDDRIPTHENKRRIAEAGCADRVIPLEANAKNLPIVEEHFDAIVAIQSYLYYGADETYLPNVLRFLKPGGQIGIVDACFTREISSASEAPDYVKPELDALWSKLHSLNWWIELWEKEPLVEIVSADYLPETEYIFSEYLRDHGNDSSEKKVVEVLRQDREGIFSLFRMVGRKRSDSED